MKFSFNIPTKENKKLERIRKRVEKDLALQTLWKASNINAIDRLGYNDHGSVHVKIVSNIALKLLRLLVAKGFQPSIVKNYGQTNGLTNDDAEVVVVLAALLHDIGMSVHRDRHELYSLMLAPDLLNKLLEGYKGEKKTIMSSEIMHAILAHDTDVKPFTLEAGTVRVADALDMSEGRARIPFHAGSMDIHSVSAMSITGVTLNEGKEVPIEIKITMENPAGVFQIDELLRAKITNSGLEDKIRVICEVTDTKEKKFKHFEISLA